MGTFRSRFRCSQSAAKPSIQVNRADSHDTISKRLSMVGYRGNRTSSSPDLPGGAKRHQVESKPSVNLQDEAYSSQLGNVSSVTLNEDKKKKGFSLRNIRFSRSRKVPAVPPLPPSLVLDLEMGKTTALAPGAQVPASLGSAQPPSAAAELAAKANAKFSAAQNIPKPVGQQRRKMLEAMSNARLDVAQTRDLVRLCGKVIRERGLETLGLFRSFRMAESTDRIEYLIQLYLIFTNPSAYASVFPVLPENALERLSQRPEEVPDKSKAALEELEKELRYASPHDVVAVLKWGLRHMKLRTLDFNSSDSYEWYDSFVAAEQASQYHPRAIADFLHPKLPQETAELFSEMLDLMANVASHHVANHMPASYICRVLGFWLIGRVGVAHPPPTFNEFVDSWERSSKIIEHLLLAHIRAQAAVTFLMPLRLMELVEGYPYIPQGATAPRLPPTFAERQIHTLRVELKSENLFVSTAKPRSPSATLASALDARASETLEGGRGETWAAVMDQLQDSAVENCKGTELLIDEHARIFRLVDNELAARDELRKQAEEKRIGMSVLTPNTSAGSYMTASSSTSSFTCTVTSRRRSQSFNEPRLYNTLATLQEDRASNEVKPKPNADNSVMEVLDDSQSRTPRSTTKRDSVNWQSFTDGGFGATASETDLTLASIDLKPSGSYSSQTLPSRRSMRRQGSFHGSLGRKRSLRSGIPNFGSTDDLAPFKPPPPAIYIVTSVSMTTLPTSLTTVWQDSLLDISLCCSLPSFVFVQLDEKAAAQANLLGGYRHDERPWLLISETITPPRPPTPEERKEDQSDRKSIFAPSIRSVKSQLRRVSSVFSVKEKRL